MNRKIILSALPALIVCCAGWARSAAGAERTQEIERIADNILLYQRDDGGWPGNGDMTTKLGREQKEKLVEARSGADTTFDNGATSSQIGYLAKAYGITKAAQYKDGCLRGIDFTLSAQYANGGWPQYFPLRPDGSRRVTLENGAMTGVLRMLKDIVDDKPEYSFVDPARREKAADALEKGVDCLLDIQITDDAYLTGWALRYDEKDLRPAGGAEYEQPSISNVASADAVLFLMSLDKPDEQAINAIEAAVDWFQESKKTGIRVQATNTDRIVVADPTAPLLWARLNELGSHKPLFPDERGLPVKSLAYMSRERRLGHDFYTDLPQKVLDRFPEWQKKMAGIEWVTIPGGSFMMGADDIGSDAKPRHRVTVKTFQMAKTLVTFEQYMKCVEDDACTAPHVSDGSCYSWNGSQWVGKLPKSFQGDDQPVVCVDRVQARTFARWAGGRLPTEAEWEYAARSAGKEQRYPWGDAAPDCERAVFDSGGMGCGRNSTWPVCSKPKGNTKQGLCDMAGNVWEWVEDAYHESYAGAPTDGGAWNNPPSLSHVVRGGAWIYRNAAFLRAARRNDFLLGDSYGIFGVRLARSGP